MAASDIGKRTHPTPAKVPFSDSQWYDKLVLVEDTDAIRRVKLRREAKVAFGKLAIVGAVVIATWQ